MKQLTLRGFSPELKRALAETARQRGTSLNKAALYLMRRGAGLRDPGEDAPTIGGALDRYAGTWSTDEVRRVDEAVRKLDRVEDEGFWE